MVLHLDSSGAHAIKVATQPFYVTVNKARATALKTIADEKKKAEAAKKVSV